METSTGQERSTRIVPEPFFVHSDLTTAVQIADIVAYSLNWGMRLKRMDKPTRPEIEEFGQMAFAMRYTGYRGNSKLYGIKYLDDLRPRDERA
jgi:hypothetical protein